nr:gamma-glutamyltransferase [Actinomycetota bacterium]
MLSPATWPDDEVRAILDRGQRLEGYNPAAGAGPHGVVVGSTGPFAQYVGRRVLQAGGNAIDAAVATSCAQITLAVGSWVSFAGIFTLMHFDGSSREVTALCAPFRTFAGEADPMSIPKAPTASGRTALVPGFFAGAFAAHERLGSLPWAELLAPAIWLAEQGFPVDAFLARTMRQRREVLTRTAEGRAIFTPDGADLPTAGETFRQPALAVTLRQVAEQGPSYLYTGEWAQRFCQVVQREGGRVTPADLASYAAVWGPPTRGEFRGCDVYGGNAPGWGGAALIEALHMIDASGVGDPKASPEALRWYVDIARQTQLHSTLPAQLRTDRDFAARVVQAMRAAGGPVSPGQLFSTTHSDFVVVGDVHGSAAAVCHSTNTVFWGSTGMFVDGISIPDAASFQQALLAQVAPGDLLPTPPDPNLVLRDGQLVLASSSIGAGLHEVTVQCVAAVLSGASVQEAADAPLFHGPDYLTGDSIMSGAGDDGGTGIDAEKADSMVSHVDALIGALLAEGTPPEDLMTSLLDRSGQVVEDRFPAEVMAAAQTPRLSLRALPADDPVVPRGHWGGIEPGPD